MTTQLRNIDEAFNVTGMHVSEKAGVAPIKLHTNLRQSQAGATSGIELRPHSVTTFGLLAVTHQATRPGQTIEQAGTALRAGQGHDQARCYARRP